MGFRDIVMKRYAVRQFDGRIVDDTKVIKLLDLSGTPLPRSTSSHGRSK